MNRKNLANSVLASGITNSATSVTVTTGDGVNFPAAPFYATMTPVGALSTVANSEIVQVTAVSGDTFTIVRGRRGTSGKAFATGSVIANGIYAEDMTPAGTVSQYAGIAAPEGWLLAYGQAVSRTTYSALWAAMNVSSTVTMTIASPGVVTWTGHPLRTGDPVSFTTTGALPTGVAAGTVYYANVIDANTFRLSTTRSNSYSGTWINTTGSQSGTHTITFAPWGIGDGSTTFNVPDLRGRTIAGKDDMGGTGANLLTGNATGGMRGYNLGDFGGEQSHQLTVAELPNVTGNWGIHGQENGTEFAGVSGYATGSYTGTYTNTTPRGSGAGSYVNPGFNFGSNGVHNTIQPTIITNYIIKI